MCPKTQEFYNKLLAFYLEDNSVYARLENSYILFIKKKERFVPYKDTLVGSEKELEVYFSQLSDAEITEARKVFKIRMFPASESQVIFQNGAVISAPTLQPYQQSIVNSLSK
jgi:hypothetical protein